MKPSHYLAIVVRLFSIALFLYALRQSSFLIEVVRGNYSGLSVSVVYAVASTALPVVVSILMWNFPHLIAKKIIKPEIDQPIEPLNIQGTLTVILLGVGFFTLFYAVVDSIYWLTIWHMSERSALSNVSMELGEEQKANMVATAIELGAAVAIILKARALSCRLLRLTE